MENAEEEIWQEIVGFEGAYQISTRGRVKSFVREKKNGMILQPGVDKRGYCRVRLGARPCMLVHRLVAKHFCANPNNENVIDHLDGNPRNNRASNLEWVSITENNRRMYRSGRGSVGEHRPASKLTEDQVRKIKNEYVPRKMSHRKLGKKYGVSSYLIGRIVTGQAWKHVFCDQIAKMLVENFDIRLKK